MVDLLTSAARCVNRQNSDTADAYDIGVADELAYSFDGTIEGLFSAIFASYEFHQDPSDIYVEGSYQPRLSQFVIPIPTDEEHAIRVRKGIREQLGNAAFRYILRAFQSSEEDAPRAIFKFVRYAIAARKQTDCKTCLDASICAHARPNGASKRYCPHMKKSIHTNISHPLVAPLHKLVVTVNFECERIRQFARFKHLRGDGADLWFAKVNPKCSVVPLVLGHFIERFSIQPFILYDEVHQIAGVWDGSKKYFVDTSSDDLVTHLPDTTKDEALIQKAWKRFYRAVAIESRYNPELRMRFMPKRFWSNLIEMQEDLFGLEKCAD